MKEISIDVITPVLNGEDLLERCVLSLQQSQYPRLVHTLVVDERSADRSVALAREFSQKFPKVRFIRDDGKSAAAAINHGLSATDGEIVTWLGHDNTWTEDTPWVVSDYFSSSPELDFLCGGAVIAREDGLVERIRLPLPELDLIDLYFSQFIPAQEGCFWRRRIHQKVSETIRGAFDYDLWLRFFSQEIVSASTNRTLAVFQKRAGQLSASREHYAEEMNQARMAWAVQRLGGELHDFAGRWEQLDFLLRDGYCAALLGKKRVALSPRIDLMPWAVGEFYFYVHGAGEMEIVSSQVEARLITICNQAGPVHALKVRGTEGRFRFKAGQPGFYFVDLRARGKDEPATCRMRCDEILWNGESLLRRDPYRAVAADCPLYSF
jgi:glycosyltransferase involved in cell wall biosynthesis